MYEMEVIIKIGKGLHARPLAAFVKKANEYKSSINITKSGITANGKSLLGILALNVSLNTTLKISADGVDEEQAVEALINLLKNYNC